MSNYLVVSALGSRQPTIVQELATLASKSGCNIVDSRMTEMGGEFALMMLLEGEWNALAKLEHSLPTVAARLGLTTMLRRTTPPEKQTDLLPYQIQVVARDNPGIIRDLAEFFFSLNIKLVDLYSDTYQAPHTGAPMVILNATVNIPSERPIAEVRDRFGRFCDEHNLDAAMEPVRAHA